jgi:adenosine deaminase
VKQIVRNGIEYSFLSGASYWTDATYRMVAKPCVTGIHTASCQAFLTASDKATAQADLENRFREFEADTIKK